MPCASSASTIPSAPTGAEVTPAKPMGEGETFTFGPLAVTAFRTPGHCAMHNCYHVRSIKLPSVRSILITGDLIFAGSAGGPYHCQKQLRAHLRRVLEAVPPDTVVAPGHGPMTTAGNEFGFQPLCGLKSRHGSRQTPSTMNATLVALSGPPR